MTMESLIRNTQLDSKGSSLDSDSLLCTEAFDLSELNRTPEHKQQTQEQILLAQNQQMQSEVPPTVKAIHDHSQLKDVRILQNLLRNEYRFQPDVPDYMTNVQAGNLTPAMRKVVADWMLEVVHEQNSQPEVFCLAINIMDRFLCRCQLHKSQLQLLGSVCVLIASKIREPCPIPGKTLITYTDYSITANELKEWELLVLYKLQWELSAITPLDYLDHALPRLGLSPSTDMDEVRRRTETILVVAATDYQFAYHSPSLMAASAVVTALQSLSPSSTAPSDQPAADYQEVVFKQIKLRLQSATHTATDHIDKCVQAFDAVLPGHLRGLSQNMNLPLPDSTCSPGKSPQLSPQPDLRCTEQFSHESTLTEDFESDEQFGSPEYCLGTTSSRSSSPLSAVDIFTEYNTNVLQAIFDQADEANIDSPFSILVS